MRYYGKKKTIERYLKCLETGNYEEIIKLFSSNAIVHSPLYGKINAKKFYQELFKDTFISKITLKNILFSQNNIDIAAAHFCYKWVLKNETQTSFECVDIFQFDNSGKIIELTIIYDTFQTRTSFENLKK